jgi:hypothetical protein
MAGNTNRESGVVGAHVGPNAGSTPHDDSDLLAGANPYGNGFGSPSADLNRALSYGQGVVSDNLIESDVVKQTPYDVSAPYFRNPPAAGGNPHAATGAPSKSEDGDQRASADMAAGFDALYDHRLREGQPGYDARYESMADYYRDEGFGRSGEGQS